MNDASLTLIVNAEVYDPEPCGRQQLLLGGGEILAMADRIDISGANTISTILTGLMPGTEYRVTVVGVNIDGDGPPSNITAFTTENPPFVAPATVAVTAVPLPLLFVTAMLLLMTGLRREA